MSTQEKQVTPQEVFEKIMQGAKPLVTVLTTWDELGDAQAIFVDMAAKINAIREESARLDVREAELNRRYKALMQAQQQGKQGE